MKAVFKYPGSKWSIADWIIQHFPEHHSYLEPFFGSGAVLFNKMRSPIETVNDLDGYVTNLFSWIRNDPVRLCRMVYWIPYSRDSYDQAIKICRDDLKAGDKAESLVCAAAFCAKTMMGYGFRTNESKVGFKRDIQGREAAYAANGWKNLPGKILEAAERLRGVQIENRPAAQLIREFRYPNVLIYADPPYVLSSRSCSRAMYKHEMTDEDHEELLDVLVKHPGPVIISGYSSELYESRLSDWRMEEKFTRDQTGKKKKEVIWMNFDPPAKQFSMYDLERGGGYS